MRSKVIEADTIDEAAKEILKALKEDTDATRSVSSRDNAVYLDGWDGLGASAVLRAIAQRLAGASHHRTSAQAGLEFEQVIHIDCSVWESRRALQRAAAEQLRLPAEVMAMLDRQDEEDDFRGVALGSRAEVQQVAKEIYRHVQKLNRRFLVIFHNGSSEVMDLASVCGLPMSGYSTSKLLWTFQGRFRLKPRTKVDAAVGSTTHALLSVAPRRKSREELWAYLVHQEASEIAAAAACKMNTGGLGILDQPEQVAECFLYMLQLCCRGSQFTGYDVATRGTSYWICDKQGAATDGLWRAADALQRELRLDVDYHQCLPSSPLAWSVESKPYWSSPTHGFTWILAGAIPNGDMFRHYSDKLSVLKLSRCSFSFHSPPFLSCHSLRFLWFDHCQDTGISAAGEAAGKDGDVRRCFQRLWVLDVRYTSCDQILSPQMLDLMTQLRELNVMGVQGWDMGQLQGRLPNVHKLRVTKSTIGCSCSEDDLFSEMNKVELLEFSGNDTVSLSRMRSLSGPGVSSDRSCLETVTVDESTGLERISFKGCSMLKNIFMRGWMGDIRTLDISGTAVKTLDLSATVIRHLDELRLLDCEKLCAILWPAKDQMRDNLSILLLDTTTQSGSTSRSRIETMSPTAAAAVARHGPPPSDEFPWYISVRDARLLVSLVPVYSTSRMTYVEVSSTSGGTGMRDDGIIKSGISSSSQQIFEGSEGNMMCEPGIMWMWPCPDAPDLSQQSCCYLHIQDQTRTKSPDFVIHCGKILHVHDGTCGSLPSTTKYGSEWFNLEWCRIERCPMISDCVFATGDAVGRIVFGYRLRTFWASQLSKTRYIWKWSEPWGHTRRFPVLTLLHLDCCPRLIHVLPLSKPMIGDTIMARLETLEIVWCGDLREVFPLDVYAKSHVEREPQPVTLDFPGLKRIHLHELPKLQRICALRMSTPNLETVKIRGCWSLTRLPTIDGGDSTNKAVECDCEKEWWDRLEWDDPSHARRYKTVHSLYYKKTLLRGSVLR